MKQNFCIRQKKRERANTHEYTETILDYSVTIVRNDIPKAHCHCVRIIRHRKCSMFSIHHTNKSLNPFIWLWWRYIRRLKFYPKLSNKNVEHELSTSLKANRMEIGNFIGYEFALQCLGYSVECYRGNEVNIYPNDLRCFTSVPFRRKHGH